MGTYKIKSTAKALAPIVFGCMSLFFAFGYYDSRLTMLLALLFISATGVLIAILAPKAVIVTDVNGIGRHFGRKIHRYYAWGDIERVETTTIISNDYVTILRGALGPLPVGPAHENYPELVREIRAQATNATFDKLTQSIAANGYPRRSSVPLLVVLGVVLLVFCVLMIIIK